MCFETSCNRTKLDVLSKVTEDSFEEIILKNDVLSAVKQSMCTSNGWYLTLVILVLVLHYNKAKESYTDAELETQTCAKAASLFEDVKPFKKAIREWNRLLHRFVKGVQDAVHVDEKKAGTVDIPYGFERFNMLGPIGPPCRTAWEHYGEGDGEKRACGIQALQNITSASTRCDVYSIGHGAGGNTWAFEEDIVRKTPCYVHTFDCTQKNVKVPVALKLRVTYYEICLGDSDEGKFRTWSSLHNLTGVVHAPAYLKMDIEGYEFPVMSNIIDTGRQLPLQIAMEIHTERSERDSVQKFRRVGSMELYAFINYLRVFGGYYMVNRRDNCVGCSEVMLAKLDCHNHPLTEESYVELKKQTYPQLKNAIDATFKRKYYNAKVAGGSE